MSASPLAPVSVRRPGTEQRRTLALVMPTMSRTALLETGLTEMLDGLIANRVSLYVSDDGPDAATEQMLSGFADRLPAFHYRRNQPPLRHDRNVVRSLLWPTEDYVWILGDAGRVRPGAFEHVLGLLDDQDFLFVNSHAPETPDIPRAEGEAARRLVRDMFWHQTLTGATIYSRRVLDWLRATAPDAEGHAVNFPHLSVIADFMATHSTSIGWVGQRSTQFGIKKSYWQQAALSVWVDDWSAAVRRQPDVIRPSECPAVLASHSARMGLFNVDFLVELRRKGDLTRRYLREHPDVWHVVHLSRWKLAAICRLPLPLLTRGLAFIRRFR